VRIRKRKLGPQALIGTRSSMPYESVHPPKPSQPESATAPLIKIIKGMNMKPEVSTVTVDLAGGKQLSFETGKLAKQAHGAAVVRLGDNVVLATATANPDPREGIDFFPLTVDYREYTYAGGRFPGGFIKREGRMSDREVLTSRQIDRPVRPMFAEDSSARLRSSPSFSPPILITIPMFSESTPHPRRSRFPIFRFSGRSAQCAWGRSVGLSSLTPPTTKCAKAC